MKESFSQWLTTVNEPEGCLSFCVRLPDRTLLARRRAADFPVIALETALRGICEMTQLLKLHRLDSKRITLVYERARLFGCVRADGACLAIFVAANTQFNAAQFGWFAMQFENLGCQRN